jgi:hypothetical protein
MRVGEIKWQGAYGYTIKTASRIILLLVDLIAFYPDDPCPLSAPYKWTFPIGAQ